ncbi:beta-propeller fold lactonase family protein [Sphingomonas sp. LaA6.9]|uniref:beta-propeller fold lactonase family protein n=1 Tax=Sphingomonas sp. LaA6.9 TaxID=2919914 RepID=UPI00387E63DC
MTHLLQLVPSGGASPRALALLESERLLVLVNEDAMNVTFFALKSDGTLTPLDGVLRAAGAASVPVGPAAASPLAG